MTNPTVEQVCDHAFELLSKRRPIMEQGDFEDFAVIRPDGVSIPKHGIQSPVAPYDFNHYVVGEDGQLKKVRDFDTQKRIGETMYGQDSHLIPNSGQNAQPMGRFLEDRGYVTLSVNGRVVRVTRPSIKYLNSTTGSALDPREDSSLSVRLWKRADKFHIMYRGNDRVFVALGYWSFPFPEGPIEHHHEFVD